MSQRLLQVMLGGLLVSLGVVAQAEDPPKAREELQGKWLMAEMIQDGVPAKPERLQDFYLVFEGDKLTVVPGKEKKVTFRFTLDASKTPKTIDITFLESDEKGKTNLGIYELKEDMLKLCLPDTPQSKERPSRFASEKGKNLALMTLKRSKQ